MLVSSRVRRVFSFAVVRGAALLACSYVVPSCASDKNGPTEGTDHPTKAVVEKAVTEAIVGDPLGAGRIELTFLSGHGPVIYPDQRLVLEASGQRAHYVAFNVDYQASADGSRYQAKRVEALFLVRGAGPIDFELWGPDGPLMEEEIDTFVDDTGAARRIRQRWWETFSRVSKTSSAAEQELHDTLLQILARRHGLPLPHRMSVKRGSHAKPSQSLEAQFERAVGMLFGIESVKLAMQNDVTLRRTTRKEVADQPIPKARRMTSLQVPSYQSVPIEPIAMRVPAECFYMRTGCLTNYFAFRDFLVGWGGSLDDIVSPRAFSHDVRRKIETQLGLDTSMMNAGLWDHLISDLALIGADPLFHDGAAVGVLIETSSPEALINKIQQQRSQVREQYPGATERRITRHNRWVSFISTADHRVRSFYVIDGPYHFITNSEHLVNRFLETAEGDRSLGELDEFRYAKSKAKSNKSTRAFLYLSDPFFQNLISPRYRIEMTRRAVAKRALQELQLAHLVARAEKSPARSLDELAAANFMADDFAERPDGSSASGREGHYVDTLRGARKTFLPIPDVPLKKATRTELSGYKRFLADYNREWGRIDPVTVVFSRQGNPNHDGLDRNHLKIIVAPYARRRYALLDNHLADANPMRLKSVEGDLISVQAAVRLGPSSPAHLLSIGLQDEEVPFVLRHGHVKRWGDDADATFAQSRCYAAMTPPSLDVLKMLASVLLEGKSPPRLSPARTPSQRSHGATPMPLPPSTPPTIQVLYYMAWMFNTVSPGSLGAAKYLSFIETRDGITVVSKAGDIRDRVHASVTKQIALDPHEVNFQMDSLKGSKVEPYIQAYTYTEARRRSTQSAQLLDRWTSWLRLPPDQARHAVEDILGARFCCPLGGAFVASVENDFRWESTSWTTDSRFEANEVPTDWQFPFLRWLQEMEVAFDLERNTLTASVRLTTRSLDHARGENRPMAEPRVHAAPIDSVLHVGSATDNVKTASFDTDPESDWLLGVRVSAENQGMTVSSVYPNSPASRAGILSGDVILKIDGQVPKSTEKLRVLIRDSQEQGLVWIELRRVNAKIQMRVPL